MTITVRTVAKFGLMSAAFIAFVFFANVVIGVGADIVSQHVNRLTCQRNDEIFYILTGLATVVILASIGVWASRRDMFSAKRAVGLPVITVMPAGLVYVAVGLYGPSYGVERHITVVVEKRIQGGRRTSASINHMLVVKDWRNGAARCASGWVSRCITAPGSGNR